MFSIIAVVCIALSIWAICVAYVAYNDRNVNKQNCDPDGALSVGMTGKQGVKGPCGFKGSTRPGGGTGLTGLSGLTGPVGEAGKVGSGELAGLTGSVGAGATGHTGNTGADGLMGAEGVQGLTGSADAAGATGNTVADGLTGAEVVQGLTGAAGAVGAAGLSGVVGATESTGLTESGQVGAAGPTGATGPPAGKDSQMSTGFVAGECLQSRTAAAFASSRLVQLLDRNHIAAFVISSKDTLLMASSIDGGLTFTSSSIYVGNCTIVAYDVNVAADHESIPTLYIAIATSISDDLRMYGVCLDMWNPISLEKSFPIRITNPTTESFISDVAFFPQMQNMVSVPISYLRLTTTLNMVNKRAFVAVLHPTDGRTVSNDPGSTACTWSFSREANELSSGVYASKIGMFSIGADKSLSATISSTDIAVVVSSAFPPFSFKQGAMIKLGLSPVAGSEVTAADIYMSPPVKNGYRLSATLQKLRTVDNFKYTVLIGSLEGLDMRYDYTSEDFTEGDEIEGLIIQCIPTRRHSRAISANDTIYISSSEMNKFTLTSLVKLAGVIGKGFIQLSPTRLACLVNGAYYVLATDADGAPIALA